MECGNSSKESIVLTKYIAAWNWHLTAMIFLVSSLILFSIPRTLISKSFYVAFFLIFIACEFMALKRKWEVFEDE
jgi:hypothetical protein